MMKIYVVLNKTEAVKAFVYKFEAHSWTEHKYGSKADGICADGVNIQAIELVND